jgi:hypothetical protein
MRILHNSIASFGLALLSSCALFGLDGDGEGEDGDDGGQSGTNGAQAIDCMSAPVLQQGSTHSGYLSQSSSGEQSCGSLGASSNEHYYLFAPNLPGTYRFRVTATFDAVLYLVDSPCTQNHAPPLSFACTDNGVGTETVETYLASNNDFVMVVVDGYGSSATGNYELVAELVGGNAQASCRQPCTSNADCGLGDHPEACLATTAGMICVSAECSICFNNELSCSSDPDTCEFLGCT